MHFLKHAIRMRSTRACDMYFLMDAVSHQGYLILLAVQTSESSCDSDVLHILSHTHTSHKCERNPYSRQSRLPQRDFEQTRFNSHTEPAACLLPRRGAILAPAFPYRIPSSSSHDRCKLAVVPGMRKAPEKRAHGPEGAPRRQVQIQVPF